MSPDIVIAEARKWLGVPFHHQGRVRAGVDCVGLVVVVLSDLGIMPKNTDTTDYGRHPDGMLIATITQHCTRLGGPAPGALAVIRWWRQAHHVGIVGHGTLIHAHQSLGGVTEHSLSGRWLSRVMGYYALPGVDYGR